jgi:hypothetical protein
MRLTWVSGCAMVHSGAEPGAGMTSLVAKASGSSELPVVVTSHTLRLLPAMMNELADVLAERLPTSRTRVRLVAWNSGCLHDDRPAPAYQLASRLGVEVIAPAGPLLGVPGGSLFAPAGRGAQRPGGWWRFAPGSAPSRVGWRYPGPRWDAELGDIGDLGHDLVVEQVPAGLWLHRSGYRSVTDLVFSVPVDPADPALIVSHPSEAPLRRDELARALALLPRRTLERLVFTPYGPQPLADGRLGDVAATALGAPVRVRAGVPLYATGGKRALVTVDSGGRPLWRPFVRESRYLPHGSCPQAADWTNPAPGVLAPPVAQATFALGSGWAAEVIEAGLWIRPEQPAEAPDWARTLPLAVDECTVVVGTPSANCPPPPAPLICDLLRNLPADARSRVRLAVHRDAGYDVLSAAAAVCEQLPGTGDVRRLGPPAQQPASPVAEPTPYPSRPVYQASPEPDRALRQPTPYPAQPAYQPTPPPAHAAREVPPPTGAHPVRQPTPYPAQPAYQPTPPPAHAARELPPRPAPGVYQASPPQTAHQPAPPVAPTMHQPPVPAARQPVPPPAQPAPRQTVPPPAYSAPAPRQQVPAPRGVHQATPPPTPTVYGQATAPSEENPLLARGEIRSHRTAGGKPSRSGREDDKATTSELNRLLGFFDEIRKARAWDEEPAGAS